MVVLLRGGRRAEDDGESFVSSESSVVEIDGHSSGGNRETGPRKIRTGGMDPHGLCSKALSFCILSMFAFLFFAQWSYSRHPTRRRSSDWPLYISDDVEFSGDYDDVFNVHGIIDEVEGVVPKLRLPRWVRRPMEGKPRVMIVSDSLPDCDDAEGVHVARQVSENRLLYSLRRDAMDMWMAVDPLVDSADPSWNMIFLMQKLLETHTDYDWFLFLAPDVVLLDMDFEIPWERYEGSDLVIWGSKEAVYSGGLFGGIEPRVMLVRQSSWSVSLMRQLLVVGGFAAEKNALSVATFNKKIADTVKGMPMKRGGEVLLTPQVALLYLLKTGDGIADVGRKVHFENSYHLSGCWEKVVPKLDEYGAKWVGDGVEPPFAVSFEGCNFCNEGRRGKEKEDEVRGSASLSACRDAFRRARDFALNHTASSRSRALIRRVPPAAQNAAMARLKCDRRNGY